ncbi:hypothetical protein AA313_de0207900 [Arthrobotrys entomopaga]|nr:hypothetical protein AA313_de0207900 [Arthrobotrys entomopaga]
MKPKMVAAGTLLPSTFYLLTFLPTSSQAYIAQSLHRHHLVLPRGTLFTRTFGQPVAQAQQQNTNNPSPKSWPVSTILTTTIGGHPAQITIFDCPIDTSLPFTVLTVTTTATLGGATPTATAVSTIFETSGSCPAYTAQVVQQASPSPSPSSSGLSTAAVAGIAVSISVPIFAGIAFFFCRLYSRRKEEEEAVEAEIRRDKLIQHRRNLTNSTSSGVTDIGEVDVEIGSGAGKKPKRAKSHIHGHGVITSISAG